MITRGKTNTGGPSEESPKPVDLVCGGSRGRGLTKRSKQTDLQQKQKLPGKILIIGGNTNVGGPLEEMLDPVELVCGGGGSRGSTERSDLAQKQPNNNQIESVLLESQS